MDKTAPESLIEHFSKLEDPRIDRNKKHELIDVIVAVRMRGGQWRRRME